MGYFQKFTVVGASTLLLTSLSACTYIIPKDPSEPRYNKVLGERRMPTRNKAGIDAAREINASKPLSDASPAPAESMAAMQAQAPAPVAEVQVTNLPPMATATSVVPPVATATMPEFPPVDVATRAAAERIDPSIRQIPTENSSYTVAENSFSNVPPYPAMPGSDSPQARLNNVRHSLESARDQAAVARDQLSRDAAAEPSMLSPLPNTPQTVVPVQPSAMPAPVTVPTPAAPVVIAPTQPQVMYTPVPQAAPQIMYNPAPQTTVPQQNAANIVVPQVAYTQPPQGYIALPPPPPMAASAPVPTPVAPTVAKMAAPQTFTPAPQVAVNAPTTAPIQLRTPHAFDPMAPVASTVVASAPATPSIQLRAPMNVPQTTVVAQPEPVTTPVAPQVASSSSFNPMAVPASGSSHVGYASNGFMEPSRYITRRN